MKNRICGSGMDRMPNFAFRLMSLIFDIRDRFVSVDKLLDEFGIRAGQTVVDYGCGPGSYVGKASRLVGPGGRVFAIDIHELAIAAIQRRIQKENFDNVTGRVAANGRCPLDDHTADLIYAPGYVSHGRQPGSFFKGTQPDHQSGRGAVHRQRPSAPGRGQSKDCRLGRLGDRG